MAIKKKVSAYYRSWRYPTGISLVLSVCWFSESFLAFGPGWTHWWLLGVCLNWLVFLVLVLRHRGLEKACYAGAFVFCVVVHIGGCWAMLDYTTLPMETDLCFPRYERMLLGRDSQVIPAGAWNIRYRYTDGWFASMSVTCNVTERDFRWFCWRNGYKYREGSTFVNERTGDSLKTQWFECREGDEAYYSYFDVYESCGGIKILYDRKLQKMQLDWSSN